MGGAIKGIFVGILMFFGSFILLFWNEGRAVKTYKALLEGSKSVISVSNVDSVDSANDNKLIHIFGSAEPKETLTDDDFKISQQAIRLSRNVEMYQWKETEHKETKKKVGGGTQTTTSYSYAKGWNSGRQNSEDFHESAGHENPIPKFKSMSLSAKEVDIGAFRLSPSLISKIGGSTQFVIEKDHMLKLDPAVSKQMLIHDGGFYVSGSDTPPDPASPKIGDLRIKFNYVQPTEVSLVSQQVGNSFQAYTASNGRKIELLQTGKHTADQMFDKAQADNVTFTWILRLVGFVVMAFGVMLVLSPITVAFDVIPILGNFAQGVIFIVAALIAGFFSLLTIGIAWLFYRPLLAIALFAVAAVLIFGVVWLIRSFRKKSADAAPIKPAVATPAGDLPEIVD